MKKRFLFIASIGAILLSSCGLMSGDRELSDEEIDSLFAKITEQSKEEVKDFNLKYKETRKYLEDDKLKTVVEDCVASANQDGEFSLSRERTIDYRANQVRTKT